MREFSHKLVTFTLTMTEGVLQAQLKRELDSLSKQIFDIDLSIQQLRKQGLQHTQTIAYLEAAKLQIHKEILENEV